MSLKIENIKEGMTFYEFTGSQKAEFVATTDGHEFVDESNNEYWRVFGRNVDTGEEIEFFHLKGYSDYPRLYDYEAYESPEDEGC